jgi:HAD superfamily hydrolase (TIGR01457 family)
MKMQFSTLFDNFLIDLDGVVYLGNSVIKGAEQAIEYLRARGKGVVFITNDPRSSPREYAEKLQSMGIAAESRDVITSVMAVVYYLKKNFAPVGKTAFVVGTASMKEEISKAGLVIKEDESARGFDFVIVGGHPDFNYREMKIASLAVRRGAIFIATNRDPAFPTLEGLVPGTGAILASIETASGKTATSVGKPERIMFEAALAKLPPSTRTAVVGDRLDSDILGGKNSGLSTILTLSGSTKREELEGSDIQPDYVIESIADLICQG